MSSRNIFLSPKERQEAALIFQALKAARKIVSLGQKNGAAVRGALRAHLQKAKLARIDYAEIVDAATLERVVKLKKGMRLLIAAAVFFGKTRLIDNILVKG